MPATLAELARRFGGRVHGAGEIEIVGVAPLDQAGPQHIAYVNDRKYRPQLTTTKAGAVVLSQADATGYNGNALIVDSPQLCFAHIAAFLHPPITPPVGIHASAVIDPTARVAPTVAIGPNAVIDAGVVIADDVTIGAGCYVGRDVVIGSGTQLIGHVWIGERCLIGRDCIFQPGAVIGGDGFGYAKDGERWVKVPQLGRVVVGDAVEIGANTTVDRGALGDTLIGDGVKLDNLIQIAHNVRIGEHTIMAACVGIAGSVTIGRRCAFGGQVGVAGHLEIADDVQILGTSLVAGPIRNAGTYSSALPIDEAKQWRRNAARLRQLDEMAQRLRQLEQDIEKLRGESP
ncbi:MAG: UDP-3-O-(3-hydroxymyristoyl)glucosamine N-acyltransferase [Gammaproteobacteria bacterium]|nr:UDP-3-O-(3-hydroxymyristoyl)glucosamine N-acyltransferase [Gammaproteobacteria bacterium]